jgi:transposase
MADGETDPERLADLGEDTLRCTKPELIDALSGWVEPVHRQLLQLYLERLHVLDQHIGKLDQMIATALQRHQDAVIRVAEIPGLGVNSAQQLIAEMGVDAESFPAPGQFTSWAGLCPGTEESAGQNHSSRSAKGNRFVRRLLNQAAQAAIKNKGSHFQSLFRRFLPRLGYNGAIWAIAHRLGRLVWKVLHDGVRYIEQGQETNPKAKKRRAKKMVQALRKLGYAVVLTPLAPEPAAG